MLKERLERLLQMANEEDLEIAKSSLNQILKFSYKNAEIDTALNTIKLRDLEPEDFVQERDRLLLSKYYSKRSTIISVRVLNRLSKLYEVEKIYIGNNDEEEILKFAEKVNKEYFGISYVG